MPNLREIAARALLVAVVCPSLSGLLLAQTNGALRGAVRDDAGVALGGVLVVVASASQGVSGRAAVSDASGSFQIASLPAARDYLVRAAFPGLATLDLSNVEVQADRTTTLHLHGARDTDVITLVDGVSTTDPLTGKIGAQLNIESIQEIEVKTSGVTAEFSRGQGGFANIITKSGGNEFKGTFKFFWRGSVLDGDGAGIDDPQLHGGLGENGLRNLKFNDFMPFLALEGPIVKDKAWFFMANEYIQQETPVNAVNTAFVSGTRELREFLKLTWQPSTNQRLALSFNYDPQTYLNRGLNSFTREETGLTDRARGTIVTLRATSVLNPNAALETSLSTFDQRPARIPNLGPDITGNGVLFYDKNGNGFPDLKERDPGEDRDLDGVCDVVEPNFKLDGHYTWTDIDGDGGGA